MAPRFSIILVVKDGMPYLPDALNSVRKQTFKDFELIAQDGGSSDGTVEFLEGVRDLPINVASAADSGPADAYNRALTRCRGAVVGTIDADNLLEPTALARAAAFLDAHDCAAVYGSMSLVDERGRLVSTDVPGDFDRLRVMRCELVPPFATAFFVPDRCGDAFRFDVDRQPCQDFDLWLRLAHLPIGRMTEKTAVTRLSPKSLSCNVANYARFCENKLAAIDAHLEQYESSSLRSDTRREAAAGVYCWAAASVHELEGTSPEFLRLLGEAERLTPDSDRVRRLRARGQEGVVLRHARLAARSLRRRARRYSGRLSGSNSAAVNSR